MSTWLDSEGDPFIEINEEISAREDFDGEDFEELAQPSNVIAQQKGVSMSDFNLEDLQAAVVKLLQTEHDFSVEEAEEEVKESASKYPSIWHENVDPAELAKLLASGGEED